MNVKKQYRNARKKAQTVSPEEETEEAVAATPAESVPEEEKVERVEEPAAEIDESLPQEITEEPAPEDGSGRNSAAYAEALATVNAMMEKERTKRTERKRSNRKRFAAKIAGLCGFVVALVILVVLTVNAMLSVFVDHYYPTFGEYRLFAIVSDSMEPEIPTGNMIVGRVPKSEDEIQVGTVITYELRQGNSIVLITHRVTAVNVNENGVTTYTTRGDNADGTDAVRPAFSDVVGIFTGNQCGFFGYFFGFLQSAEGAVALIIILLIIAITWIIVHFVNLVTIWRKVALTALKKSGTLLSETQIEELGTIADVIGIVSKEPLDKKDIERKDKKLKWFVKTGTLPRRPYSDDFDEKSLPHTVLAELPKLVHADDQPVREIVKEVIREKIVEVPVEVPVSEEFAAAEASGELTPAMIREKHEKMSYTLSLQARIIQLKPQSKEWYSLLKNELLSYKKVRVREGNRFETFMLGRSTVARLTVRGKTLCLQLAADPDAYADSKYTVERINTNTPCQYRIKSGLRARYACALIGEVLGGLGAVRDEGYVPQDFYKPYEGVVTLMEKGLVKRNIKTTERTYKIVEVTDEDEEE